MVTQHAEHPTKSKQVVPVNDTLTNSFAEQLDRLKGEIQHRWAWPSPSAGMCAYLLHRMNRTLPHVAPDVQSLVDSERMDAPVMATAGFASRMGLQFDVSLEERLNEGFARLGKRDAYPRDRQSFAFRPSEMLGVCLLASHIRSSGDSNATWVRDVLGKLDAVTKGTNAWGRMTYAIARMEYQGGALDLPTEDLRTLRLPELALLYCLVRLGGLIAGAENKQSANTEDRLREDLLRRCLTERVETRESEELSAVYCALDDCLAVAVGHIDDDPSGTRKLQLLGRIFERFQRSGLVLGNRHGKRPKIVIKDEYDVQDMLHSLLLAYFEVVIPEEHTPSTGGVPARIDFLLKRERIVVETKMTRKSLGQKEVFDELVADRERYKAHPDADHLVCFVYDPDHRCRQPEVLEQDLLKVDGRPKVTAFVYPK